VRPPRHRFGAAVVLALAVVAVASLACRRAPAPPRLLVVGPQVTCVTGPAPVCAGDCTFQIPADLTTLSAAHSVTFGLRHGCLLDAVGRVSCWGDATQGQLGIASAAASERCLGRPCRTAPVAVDGAPPLRTLEAGWLHTCGVSAAGGVICWGDDSLDQLGRADPGPGPAAVEGLTAGVSQVSAGGIHTCARRDDGGVVCWGDGSEGQLGQGSDEDSPRPVAVQGLPGPVAEISAGGYHTCARMTDGGIRCWGENRYGQLGDGTRTARTTAVPVQGLAGPVRALAVGSSFSCALLTSGAVQCWGSNEMGEQGLGFESNPPSPRDPVSPPTTVKGLESDVVALQAAGNHACVELADDSIFCWGANQVGQLGTGRVTGGDLPVAWEGRRAPLPHPAVAVGPGPVEGFDVSYHSGRVDWHVAKAQGHRFGLTMATAGVDFLDPFFQCHWERMRQAGLIRGAYHFFEPDDDPEAQARVYLSHVLFEPGDLAPVVDVETRGSPAPADLPDRLLAFIQVVERTVGIKPIIYTGPAFWNQNMNRQFGGYPLWVAEYGVDQPHVPAGWERWHLWQWRGNATIPEIAPIVDLDRVHPDLDIRELLIPDHQPE
jgi:GH25 family lysozyme M1 (1,4-beta-N-acetylmuramidase)/alpha-tubulin suppressor-like RCC1 family protein